ncbi:prepilin-type N-terminal cleavage/methylation domain-containing protein [Raoultella ornithinolytica 10-5246]|nr:prepilin-type N-terminal cleavage/methylation domain-containing protein [Raoultella ornithinolytica 10-5246]
MIISFISFRITTGDITEMKKIVLLKNRKSKKGFSLLELLLVLGIIAALVVAAFIVYPKVQASQRAQAESNNIATIQAGVKALYTSTSSFTGLTNSVAAKANIFPDNMLINSGTFARPINAFKGNVTLAADKTGPSGADGSSFTITYSNVPAAECTKIITAAAGNFYTAGVGTAGNVKAAGEVLDVAKTATQCQNGGNSNTLIFTSL